MRRDPIGLFMQARRDHGPLVRLNLGPMKVYVVGHPDYARHILVERAANYGYNPLFIRAARPALGAGLLTTEGDAWLRQRRILQPLFHRHLLVAMAKTMARVTAEFLAGWSDRARRVEVVDVHKEMLELTLRIVGWTLFSADLGGATDELSPSVALANRHTYHRMTSLLPIPSFVPTPQNLRFARALRRVDAYLQRVIEEHRRSERDDLLTMLLLARGEDGAAIEGTQLRDEVMTFFVAGHETSAAALTWILYLLAKHPDAARRARQEVHDLVAAGPPVIERLGELRFTTRLIQEAMRLYPPVWIIGRVARSEDELGGFAIERGANLFASPYLLHRAPECWSEPEDFDPERFLPERIEARPKHAYLPFGAGQRMCIGNHFAMLEMQIVVSQILKDYDLSRETDGEVIPEAHVTLRPAHGFRLRLARAAPQVRADERPPL